MKIRNGFVSNSSSSSFIIALKNDGEICPHCKRQNKNIISEIEKLGQYDFEETRLWATGKKEVLEKLSEWFCTESDKSKYNSYKKDIEELEKHGNEIAWIEISYHNDSLNKEFNVLKNSGKLKVILDEDDD